MDSYDTLEDVINGILEDEEISGNESDEEKMEDSENETTTVRALNDETLSQWILIINSKYFEYESITC